MVVKYHDRPEGDIRSQAYLQNAFPALQTIEAEDLIPRAVTVRFLQLLRHYRW